MRKEGYVGTGNDKGEIHPKVWIIPQGIPRFGNSGTLQDVTEGRHSDRFSVCYKNMMLFFLFFFWGGGLEIFNHFKVGRGLGKVSNRKSI